MQTILLLRRKKQREEGGEAEEERKGGERRESGTALLPCRIVGTAGMVGICWDHWDAASTTRHRNETNRCSRRRPRPPYRHRCRPISGQAGSLGAAAGVKLVTYQPDTIKSERLLSDLFPLRGSKQNHVSARKKQQQHTGHTHMTTTTTLVWNVLRRRQQRWDTVG